MKPGDLILATSHSYPLDYKRGEELLNYAQPTPVIFLEQFPEAIGTQPRIFYRIITPSNGIHVINSCYCSEVVL